MTEQEYNVAKEMFLTGQYSLTAIGEELKINRKKLSAKLKEDGLYRGKSYNDSIIEEAKRLLEQGVNITNVCKQLNVDRFAFSRTLREKGILEEKHPSSNHNNRIDYDGEWAQSMIADYHSKMSKRDIMKKYKISEQVFYNVLRHHKVKRENNRTLSVNTDTFKVIDTPEKAYWLGFLYADGYVSESNSVLELTLKESDKEHVETFRDFMMSDAKVYERKSKIKGEIFTSYRVSICSQQVVSDLVQQGCYQNKSLTLEPPTNVPSELIRHFIRGYFDGDGCVYKIHNGNAINFVGTQPMLEWIQKEIGVYPKKLAPCGNAYQFSFKAKNSVTYFYNYIYDQATVFLPRKKNKFVLPSMKNAE